MTPIPPELRIIHERIEETDAHWLAPADKGPMRCAAIAFGCIGAAVVIGLGAVVWAAFN